MMRYDYLPSLSPITRITSSTVEISINCCDGPHGRYERTIGVEIHDIPSLSAKVSVNGEDGPLTLRAFAGTSQCSVDQKLGISGPRSCCITVD